MLVIHPGFPKTGTTFLQEQLAQYDWYVGPSGRTTLSTAISQIARTGTSEQTNAFFAQLIEKFGRSGTGLLSEEAYLSLRPHEMSLQVGMYKNARSDDFRDLWVSPERKLIDLARAASQVDHCWLITIRKHVDWAYSYARYAIDILEPQRAGLFLRNLTISRTVGGPIYSDAVEFIHQIDPDAKVFVIPMEAFTQAEHLPQFERFLADTFSLHVGLSTDMPAVNQARTAEPRGYKRLVSSLSHRVRNKQVRGIGRRVEGAVSPVVRRLAKRPNVGRERAVFERDIQDLRDEFIADTERLQPYCPFDLKALGY